MDLLCEVDVVHRHEHVARQETFTRHLNQHLDLLDGHGIRLVVHGARGHTEPCRHHLRRLARVHVRGLAAVRRRQLRGVAGVRRARGLLLQIREVLLRRSLRWSVALKIKTEVG